MKKCVSDLTSLVGSRQDDNSPCFTLGAPMTTMGSRPGARVALRPTSDRYIRDRYAPHPGPPSPRAMPGPVMPGVRRTPGRLCGGDAPGGPDPPPCPGYFTPYISHNHVHVMWKLKYNARTGTTVCEKIGILTGVKAIVKMIFYRRFT